MNLPKDPVMLMSFINTKLRDEFDSLDEFCASLGIDKEELVAKLKDAGFDYNVDTKQFR